MVASMSSDTPPPEGGGDSGHRRIVNLRIWWNSELTRDQSRSRIRGALRGRNVSVFLVKVPRSKRLFVDIFRVESVL